MSDRDDAPSALELTRRELLKLAGVGAAIARPWPVEARRDGRGRLPPRRPRPELLHHGRARACSTS